MSTCSITQVLDILCSFHDFCIICDILMGGYGAFIVGNSIMLVCSHLLMVSQESGPQ